MRAISIGATIVCLSVGVVSAADKETERLAEAAKTLDEIMATPDKGVPGSVFDKAECVVVIPGMKKGGFIVGGSYGKGAVSCRDKTKSHWGAPSMVELGGGSVGFQLGASATDVVMLVMNRAGMDSLLKSKFTLGGDASVAAGPVGRTSAADTDAAMQAKILSYSRSQGVFAGVSLNGMSLSQDGNANKALYGKELDATEILAGGLPVPTAAKPLVQSLMKHSPKGK